MTSREAVCSNCETIFLRSSSDLGPRQRIVFCSVECESEYDRKHPEPRDISHYPKSWNVVAGQERVEELVERKKRAERFMDANGHLMMWQLLVSFAESEIEMLSGQTEAEALADHIRHNNITHHSIDADGHCNMGCC